MISNINVARGSFAMSHMAAAPIVVAKREVSRRYFPLLGEKYKSPKKIKQEALQAQLKQKMIEAIKKGTYDQQVLEQKLKKQFQTVKKSADVEYKLRDPKSIIKTLQQIRANLETKKSKGETKLKLKFATSIGKTAIKVPFLLAHDNGEVLSRKTIIFTDAPSELPEEVLKNTESYKIGGQELVNDIANDVFSPEGFDKCFCTTTMLRQVITLAKKLGPLGLMPSAKKGTAGNDMNEVLKNNSSDLDRAIQILVEEPVIINEEVVIGNVKNLNDIELLENVISVRSGISHTLKNYNLNHPRAPLNLFSFKFECDDFEPVDLEYTKY
ncbi:hypothetical protein QEN19_002084 [Hanseniaspora menglaensis]